MSRDLPAIPTHGFEPRLPQRPEDIGRTDYPEPIAPPKRRRDVEGTPRQTKRVTTDTPEGERRATGWKRPGPGKSTGARQAGRNLGESFGRLSGADAQRSEGMAQAMADGFRNAREQAAADAELARDPDFMRSAGFYGRSEDDL